MTLVAFLFGRRSAIESVALARWSIAIGLLFTISAGLARTYDGADLLHEPWHAFRGIPVALANSLLLFSIVFLAVRRRSESPPRFGPLYRAFLGAFLMTAPLAWLYAIPYERFLTPVGAINANLWTLAFVAAWRVLLIGRVLAVLLGFGFLPLLLIVLLWSDVVVFLVSISTETPVADLMGGLHHSPEDAAFSNAVFTTAFFAILAAPVLLIAALVALVRLKPRGHPLPLTVRGTPRSLAPIAIVSVLAWIPVLPFVQPEQINRRYAERLLTSGRAAEALSAMSSHVRTDYPPVWDPPPRLGFYDPAPPIESICQALDETHPAPWVRDLFIAKVRRVVRQDLHMPFVEADTDWQRTAQTVAEYHSPPGIGAGTLTAIRCLIQHDPTLTPDDRIALESIASRAAASTSPAP